MRILFAAVMICVVVLASGCVAEKALSKNEIALRVESVLREPRVIKVKTTVTQSATDGSPRKVLCGNGPYVIISIMGKDFVTSKVWEGNKFLAIYIFTNWEMYESFLVQKEGEKDRSVVKKTKTAHSHGAYTEIDLSFSHYCIVGGHIFSWVGVPAENDLRQNLDQARDFRVKIERSEQLPDVVWKGRRCYAFLETLRIPEGERTIEITNTLYVEKGAFWVRYWATTHKGVLRVRENDFEVLH